MLSTKFRPTVATLAVTFVVAVAMAPAAHAVTTTSSSQTETVAIVDLAGASSEAKNMGNYRNSIEAFKSGILGGIRCADLQSSYDYWINQMTDAARRGDDEAARGYLDQALGMLGAAKQAGCTLT